MSSTLDTLMGVVLLRLEMCGAGSTQAWNASGGHTGEPDDKVVLQVIKRDEAPHLRYRRRYDGCSTDRQRREVFLEATDEWKAIRVRSTPAKEAPWVSVEALVLEDDIGVEPHIVAYRRSLDVALVRKIRMKDGRDSETGEKLGVIAVAAAERRERAAVLRARGLSLRQIAMHLGVSAEMVRRDLAA